MFCAKFGSNWSSGSGEEVKNVIDNRQTDARQKSDYNSLIELSTTMRENIRQCVKQLYTCMQIVINSVKIGPFCA